MTHLLADPLTLLRLLAVFPFLFFLPGYATQLVLRPGNWPLRWSEGVFLSVLLSVLLVSPVALLLAEVGRFSLALVRLLSGLYVIIVLWLARRRRLAWWPEWASPDRWDLALLILVVLSVPLLARPHEYVLGGSDAGVYVSLGANLARTGSLVIQDPLLALLPADGYATFLRPYPANSAVEYARFAGFFVEDAARGAITPQFFHLHPVWLGLLFSAGGIWAALLLPPLWALLGGLAVYFAVSAVFGRRVGLLALVLLTVSPLQIWFARYPTAEALTQFLWYGAIFATLRYVARADAPRLYGLTAGLAWGTLLAVRIDAFYTAAVPLVLVLLLVLNRRWRPRHGWFLVPWLLTTLQAVLHAALIAHAYMLDTFRPVLRMLHLSPTLFLVIGGVALLIVMGAGAMPAVWRRLSDWIIARRRLWGILLLTTIILAAVYAYFLRPCLEQGATHHYWYGGQQIQSSNQDNLVRLGWYLSPLGLALGVMGLAWTAGKKLDRRTILLFGLGVFSTFLYVYNILNNPHLVYAMRRYVPSVVPTLVVGAAVLLGELWKRARGKPAGRWLAAILALLVVGQNLWVNRIYAPQVDYQGVVDQLDALAQQLPDDALLLINDRSPVGWGDMLGTPLTYLYGERVLSLRGEPPNDSWLADRLAAWTAQGLQVWLAPGAAPEYAPMPGWQLEPLDRPVNIHASVLESSYETLPQRVVPVNLLLDFYRVVPAVDRPVELPVRLDVGGSDLPVLGNGFYGSETAGGRSYRWTGPSATLLLPGDLLERAGSIRLSLAAYRPEAGPTPVELFLDGVPWATVSVGQEFTSIDERLPAHRPYPETVALTLQVEPWNPARAGVSEDDRELGVMVDWVELLPAAQ